MLFGQDMEPSINPPKEIDDPKDFKPSDWVDEEMIDDPEAKKPEGRNCLDIAFFALYMFLAARIPSVISTSFFQIGMKRFQR